MEAVSNEIWHEYRHTGNPKIREQICEHYAFLVRLVAGRLISSLPSHVDLDELIANGFIGLLQAIDRFDPSRGYKFETYATSRIRGAILDGLRAADWVPHSVRKRIRELEQESRKVDLLLGRPATHAELAESMGITLKELDQRMQEYLTANVISLHEPWFGQDNEVTDWSRLLSDKKAEDPFENAWLAERQRLLADSIDVLPKREQLIISLHYFEGLTGAEIARVLDLTPARISQLHARALIHLRSHLQGTTDVVY